MKILFVSSYKDHTLLGGITTIFSIHNLSSQGTDKPQRFLSETQQDDGYGSIPDFFSDRMRDINSMKRGIIYADAVNTVSRT